MIGNKVQFVYIATGSSLPASYPNADTIYFLEETKQIQVGDKVLGNVDDLAIHPDQLAQTLTAWTIKSITITGSGDNVSNITFDSSTGVVTVTKSNLPVLSKGVSPTPQVVELEPEGTFTVSTGTTVDGHEITDSTVTYKLPDSKVYTAGDGIVISGDTIALPQVFYDYLVSHTFAPPAISVFTVPGLGSSAEIGTSVTISSFTHRETNIVNINGDLTLKHGTTVILDTITPSSSDASVPITSTTITRTTPGTETLTLSGTDTLGGSFSKSVNKTFYIPKFLGTDPDPTVTAAEILNMSKGSSIPTTITLAATGYIYFVTDGTINSVKDADTGFGVPIESPVSTSVTINSIPVTYNVYRTSDSITSGTYNFTIS